MVINSIKRGKLKKDIESDGRIIMKGTDVTIEEILDDYNHNLILVSCPYESVLFRGKINPEFILE